MTKTQAKTILRATGAQVASDELFQGVHPSRWSFWGEGVRSSFISMFLNCRETTRLSYVEGWKARYEPLALAFGTAMHWCLEQVYATGRNVRPSDAALRTLVGKYEKEWRRSMPEPTPRQLEQLELVLGMCEAVLPAYMTRWEGDFTGRYRYPSGCVAPVQWESLEEKFAVPYVFPDGRATQIIGTRDGVFSDKRGKRWVFDTKTKSVIVETDIIETLPVDPQMMLYCWATRELSRGVPPAGVVMNVVRRPGQRRTDGEKLKEFLGRMKKDVDNPRRFDHYFIRYEMAVSAGEIEAWKTGFLDPIMADIRGWWEGRSPSYMNPNALITKYGRSSMFGPLVRGDFGDVFRTAPGTSSYSRGV